MLAANKNKLEIWIVPKFVVEHALNEQPRGLFSSIVGKKSSAAHYRAIMDTWCGPVGIIWAYGNWENMDWYDYLTNKQFDEISAKNLYDIWASRTSRGAPTAAEARTTPGRGGACGTGTGHVVALFSIYF